ncbi:MAG: hypothetical protein KGI54_14560 [Pseudomonadota bacterium]|nr:hypothetical protein [Pseudomonadota bacterium]
MVKFSVTYVIVSPESAESGDYEESGFIEESLPLRDALKVLFETRTSQCGGIECIEPSDSIISNARWITIHNGMEFITGCQESRSIHIPEHVSATSRQRIWHLINSL